MSHTKNTISRAGVSIALIKYWGKKNHGINIPATTSIGLTLDTLESECTIFSTPYSPDIASHTPGIYIDGSRTPLSLPPPLVQYITKLKKYKKKCVEHTCVPIAQLRIHGRSTFPHSSGFASSASGNAALAHALNTYYDLALSPRTLSALARIGSGSASRSVFGGVTLWRAGTTHAQPLAPYDYWPSLRVVALQVSARQKPHSSRIAMNICRNSSPYYSSWRSYNKQLVSGTIQALLEKDLAKLGHYVGQSYRAMHAVMLAANPSIMYLLPNTLHVLSIISELRSQGFNIWETMDAGPQVKFLCHDYQLTTILDIILSECKERGITIPYYVCALGKGARSGKVETITSVH